MKKGVLRRPAVLLKKRLWHRFFPVTFAKISKNTFFTEHLRTTASVATVLKACNFNKKRLQHRCFTVNIPEFLEQLFY